MKCYQAKAGELARQWYVIDATNAVVGRLAAQIAPILMGKHRPTYTPHIDTGDYVIVTNVDKVVFTGKKWQQKTYARYSGYPGGLKEEPAWKLFERRPERILELAIRRMMPKTKMGRHMMSKLKLYVGPNHPHQAQSPIPLAALSGRPEASGAIWAPEPVESDRPSRKKARLLAEPEAEPQPAYAEPEPELAETTTEAEAGLVEEVAPAAETAETTPTAQAPTTDQVPPSDAQAEDEASPVAEEPRPDDGSTPDEERPRPEGT